MKIKRFAVVLTLLLLLTASAVAATQGKDDKKKARQAAQKERAEAREAQRKADQGEVVKDTMEFMFVIQRIVPYTERLTLACDIRVSKDEVICYLPVRGKNTNQLSLSSTDFSYEKRVNAVGTTVTIKLNKTVLDNMPCLIDFDIPKNGEASAYVRMLTLDGGSYTFRGIVKPLNKDGKNFVGAGGYNVSVSD